MAFLVGAARAAFSAGKSLVKSRAGKAAISKVTSSSIGRSAVGRLRMVTSTLGSKIVAGSTARSPTLRQAATRLSPAIHAAATRTASGFAKMPKPLKWASEFTGAPGFVRGAAGVTAKGASKLSLLKAGVGLGVGGLGLSWTAGQVRNLLSPDPDAGDVVPTGIPEPPDERPYGGGGGGGYDPAVDDGDGGAGVDPVSGAGYGQYLKNPLVIAALGAVGVGVGAYALKGTVAKYLGKKAISTVTGKRKASKKSKKASKRRATSGKAAYSFKALGVKWRKLSKAGKAKYEGKFSDYVKVKREGGISAGITKRKSKKVGSKKRSSPKSGRGYGRRSSPGIKRQQNVMKAAARKWKSYKGQMSYREFMSKELRK